jgi:Antitoxin MazE-like
MPRPRLKISKGRSKAKARAKPTTARKTTRARNGIPLKRKVMWVYDTESPEFQAVWKKERAALRTSTADPDIEEFLDDASRDIDRSLDRR